MQEYKRIMIGKDEVVPLAQKMRQEGVVLAMIQRMADKMQRTLDTCRDAVNGRTPFAITQRRVVLRPI